MAKKSTGLEDLFKKTDKQSGDRADESRRTNSARLDDGRIQATGVGLKEGEIRVVEEVGRELGELLGTEPVARNALMRLAIRMFLEAYLDGDITIQDLADYFERPIRPRAKRKQ